MATSTFIPEDSKNEFRETQKYMVNEYFKVHYGERPSLAVIEAVINGSDQNIINEASFNHWLTSENGAKAIRLAREVPQESIPEPLPPGTLHIMSQERLEKALQQNESPNLQNCSFERVDFTELKLRVEGIDFTGSNFYGCKFHDLSMRDCNFTNCKIKTVDIKNVDFTNAKFQEARISDVPVSNSIFAKADFTRADLRHVRFNAGCIVETNFNNTKFDCVSLQNVDTRNNKNLDTLGISMGGAPRKAVEGYKESVLKTLSMQHGDISASKNKDFVKEANTEKKRLFLDLDGTAAEFKHVNTIETLYEKGYFRNLKPVPNVVNAVKVFIEKYPEVEVYILSAVLTDSPYALGEKNDWIDEHLPAIDKDHRLYPSCGSSKMDYVAERLGAVGKNDCLIDDYTPNLLGWVPPGTGIKALNGINHTKGTWKSSMISNIRNPESLADAIYKCCTGEIVSDLKPALKLTPLPSLEP